MKRCWDCKSEKPLADFSKKTKNKDGLSDQCRACSAAYRREWGRRNPEKLLALNRAHYERNAEAMRQKTRDWVAANKERKRENDRAHREKNLEVLKARNKVYRLANREEINQRKRQHRKDNPEKYRAMAKASRERNHGAVLADRAARKKRIRRAMPLWLSPDQKDEIRLFYQNAFAAKQALGVSYHVDHIVPIIHPLVCGLHVPWNLQLLTAAENIEKSNRFDGWG